jgi:hypothetical protein
MGILTMRDNRKTFAFAAALAALMPSTDAKRPVSVSVQAFGHLSAVAVTATFAADHDLLSIVAALAELSVAAGPAFVTADHHL